MHSEIKNITAALLATALIPSSYIVAIIGVFYLGAQFRIEGAAIILLAILMEVTGQIFSEQQKQQLTKQQLIKKIYTHFVVGVVLLVTTLGFIYAIK